MKPHEATRAVLRRIYYFGLSECIVCGRRVRLTRIPAMWKDLAVEWSLDSEVYELIDQREGIRCPMCGANWRVRQLARVLMEDILTPYSIRASSFARLVRHPVVQQLRIAEINSVAGLHPFLDRLPDLHYSEYGSLDPDTPSEDLMCLSYPRDHFDYVLTSDTLEHVPDFDRALAEIRRVLKPGGKHIFNIPVIWGRNTRQRANIVDGTVKFLLPPSYHAGPRPNQEDYLVFNEFGGDVLERMRRLGFGVSVHKDPANPLVSTIITKKI